MIEVEMSEKIKVLQVLDYINHNSGVSAVVMNYFVHFNTEIVQCDFLVFEEPDEELRTEIEQRGGRVYALGKPKMTRIFEYNTKLDIFFNNHLNEYNIVHVHIPNCAFMILSKARKYGIRTRIIHSHNARGADGLTKKIRNRILNKWGIRYANRYFACSIEAGKYLFGEKKVEEKKVEIINNAIDLHKYAYNEKKRECIRKKYNIREEEILLGHIGRFVDQKNHVKLLEIFVEMQKKQKNVKLMLIGTGGLTTEIKEKVKKLGLNEQVIFTGIVINTEDYLSAIDIFVLPSKYEGLPVVCVEAQASGLPCLISTNVSREIKLTKNVHFIDNNNVLEWVKCIEKNINLREERKSSFNMEAYDIEKQTVILERKYKEM